MKDSIKKYDYIDALRGFAILGVVMVHTAQWIAPSTPVLDIIAHQGARGVQLFFLVSALTLFLSLDARRGIEHHPVADFFIRRLFRIAPMFYLAILVYSSPLWVPEGMEARKIALTALFLHGWHPDTINTVVPGGWTIAVEMTFYLLVPLLFLKLKDIWATMITLLCTLILAKVLTAAVATQFNLGMPFTFFWFFSQFPVFILGILLFHIIKTFPEADQKVAYIMLGSALFLFVSFLSVQTFSGLLPTHVLYGMAFLLLALSLHYVPNKLFVNRVTILIGQISFSLYLVHFMVRLMMKTAFSDGFLLQGDAGFMLAYLFILLPSCAIAYITYRFIEQPGIALGKRIIYRYF